ncbi:MAG: glycosyltransferase family 2 protein [Candidatus Sigynarchaeota archaeon]
MPTKNEAKAIEPLLHLIQKGMKNFDYEVIIIDKSDDETPDIIKKLVDDKIKLIFQRGKGYGDAYKIGIKESRGSIIVFIDGDQTYNPLYIPRFIHYLERDDVDFVNGKRILTKGSMSSIHIFGNLILSRLIQILFNIKIHDTQCGLRAIKRKALRRLDLREKGMSFASEMVIESKIKGIQVAEITIYYRERVGKRKLNTIRDGFYIGFYILKKRIQTLFQQIQERRFGKK